MVERNQQNGEIVVPAGMLFAMGDNRQNSSDSRYWGFVPRDTVKGRPLFVYWSYDAPTEDLAAWKVSHLVDVGLLSKQDAVGADVLDSAVQDGGEIQ
jgi:signal peptidase I